MTDLSKIKLKGIEYNLKDIDTTLFKKREII